MPEQARWGSITRIKVFKELEYLPDRDGGTYKSGNYWIRWLLKCDCGHEWEVREIEFDGKWTVRHCGRPECPYKPKPPKPPSERSPGRPPGPVTERSTPVQIYMPMSLYLQLGERAQREGRSVSKVGVELLKNALGANNALIPAPEEPTDW